MGKKKQRRTQEESRKTYRGQGGYARKKQYPQLPPDYSRPPQYWTSYKYPYGTFKVTPDYSEAYSERQEHEGEMDTVFNTGAAVGSAIPGGQMYAGSGAALGEASQQLFETDEHGLHKNKDKATLAGGTEGALKGAGTGAAVGSVAGPLGTAIGAGAGLLAGGTYGAIKGGKQHEETKEAIEAAEREAANERANARFSGTDMTQYMKAEEGLNVEDTKPIEVERGELLYRKRGNAWQLVKDFKKGRAHEQGGEDIVAKEGDVVVPEDMRKKFLDITDEKSGMVKDRFRFNSLRYKLPPDTPEQQVQQQQEMAQQQGGQPAPGQGGVPPQMAAMMAAQQGGAPQGPPGQGGGGLPPEMAAMMAQQQSSGQGQAVPQGGGQLPEYPGGSSGLGPGGKSIMEIESGGGDGNLGTGGPGWGQLWGQVKDFFSADPAPQNNPSQGEADLPFIGVPGGYAPPETDITGEQPPGIQKQDGPEIPEEEVPAWKKKLKGTARNAPRFINAIHNLNRSSEPLYQDPEYHVPFRKAEVYDNTAEQERASRMRFNQMRGQIGQLSGGMAGQALANLQAGYQGEQRNIQKAYEDFARRAQSVENQNAQRQQQLGLQNRRYLEKQATEDERRYGKSKEYGDTAYQELGTTFDALTKEARAREQMKRQAEYMKKADLMKTATMMSQDYKVNPNIIMQYLSAGVSPQVLAEGLKKGNIVTYQGRGINPKPRTQKKKTKKEEE